MEDDARDLTLEKEVSGQYNTFRVYIHLMKAKDATAREIYRSLEMSSPSLALLHLEKLVKLKLATKDTYGYHITTSPKRPGILRFFYLMKTWFIPRTFFYTVFFLTTSIFFIVLSLNIQYYILPAIVSIISTLTNLYETIQFFQLLD